MPRTTSADFMPRGLYGGVVAGCIKWGQHRGSVGRFCDRKERQKQVRSTLYEKREEMADIKGPSTVACNDKCGCPSPCPGDNTCRCTTSGGDMDHNRCSCGEHCGCNPCNCSKTEEAKGTAGKASCKCGSGCTCSICST